MTCTYDPSTERFSDCDGHFHCICGGGAMPYRPETVTATNSHAVMAAEIARLRKAIREALLQLEMCSRPLRVANAVDTLKGALR